jgi:hypothetical protein
MRKRKVELFDDELPLEEEFKRIFANPEEWLDMPNDQLSGRKPKDLLGTDDEQVLRDLTRRIKHGMPT